MVLDWGRGLEKGWKGEKNGADAELYFKTSCWQSMSSLLLLITRTYTHNTEL